MSGFTEDIGDNPHFRSGVPAGNDDFWLNTRVAPDDVAIIRIRRFFGASAMSERHSISDLKTAFICSYCPRHGIDMQRHATGERAQGPGAIGVCRFRNFTNVPLVVGSILASQEA